MDELVKTESKKRGRKKKGAIDNILPTLVENHDDTHIQSPSTIVEDIVIVNDIDNKNTEKKNV